MAPGPESTRAVVVYRAMTLYSALTLVTTPTLAADDSPSTSEAHISVIRRTYLQPRPERNSLTNDWFGFGKDLDRIGITTTLNLWLTYQGNVTGGLETGSAFTSLYYWDNHFDLDRLLGLEDAKAFLRVEGGIGSGVNSSVEAIFDVNGAQVDDNAIELTHIWFEQDLLDDRLRFRIGKMDPSIDAFEFHGLSVAFDAMPYANTTRTQFNNAALSNNGPIAFAQSARGDGSRRADRAAVCRRGRHNLEHGPIRV